jgi:hypothetical protein
VRSTSPLPHWLLLVALLPIGRVQPRADPPAAAEPSGIYFHAWTGSSAGTEWALVHPVDGDGHRLTDVLGNGFRFCVAPDGELSVHDEGQGGSGSGSGSFLGPDEARFDWRSWGMHFSSRMWRAAGTDAAFPVLLGPPIPGDPELEGPWKATVEEISPTTGRALRSRSATARLTVDGCVLRIDWPDGSFDQGLFVAADRLAFRVLTKAPPGRYATPTGCSTSRDRDLIGQGRIEDDSITIDLFLQTRAPVGGQIQSQLRCTLGRDG